VLVTRGTDVLLIRQYRPIVDEYVVGDSSGGVAWKRHRGKQPARDWRKKPASGVVLVPWRLLCPRMVRNQRLRSSGRVTRSRRAGIRSREVISIGGSIERSCGTWFSLMGRGNLSLSPLLLFLFRVSAKWGRSYQYIKCKFFGEEKPKSTPTRPKRSLATRRRTGPHKCARRPDAPNGGAKEKIGFATLG